jgi:hypothetical protein
VLAPALSGLLVAGGAAALYDGLQDTVLLVTYKTATGPGR